MIVHATADQLAAPPWNLTPANADALLRSASLLVDRATLTAWYTTDNTGLATDSTVLAALRDATLAQAATWAALGIDPAKGAANTPASTAVRAKTLGTARVEYDTGSASDRSTVQQAYAAAATELCPDAQQILAAAGLLTGPVTVYG